MCVADRMIKSLDENMERCMLFVTNRKINEGGTPGSNSLPRRISFDTQGEDRGNVGVDIYFCERLGHQDYVEIGSEAFFTKLQNTPNLHVMTMMHGYNVAPDDALDNHHEFQELCESTGGNISIISVVWPSWAGTTWYHDDQRQADMSAIGLSKFWAKLLRWTESNMFSKRLHNFAHSMGNRVNRESLLGVATYEGLNLPSYMFTNSFMVAADVPNESLESHHPGYVVAKSSRRVIVYYAEDDNALEVSNLANTATGKTIQRAWWQGGDYTDGRRMGESGPETFSKCPDHVYRVDCDRVNEERYDDGGSWFDLGHSYYLKDDNGHASLAFQHITKTIRTGKPDADSNRHHKL